MVEFFLDNIFLGVADEYLVKNKAVEGFFEVVDKEVLKNILGYVYIF